MKVDRQEQDEARRARIARAAFELFARTGLERVSAQDIARAAFVSRTNLYRYFPSKTHMLLAHFEHTVHDTRAEALRRLSGGAAPQAVWQLVTGRMADLGVRYRHLVGAVGQAVLGRAGPGEKSAVTLAPGLLRGAGQPEVRTAQTLVGLVEPVLSAMRTQGRLRPDADTRFLAALLVDACLMSLLHGGHRDQREVLRDWQDRFSLLMHGALAPGATLESGEPAPPAGSVPPPGAVGGRSTLEEGAFPASPARAQDRPADATIP
ncbi:transcriptional regulator, TetR family [Deinococcus reticulitermitis]|uniref:Transcriptional regulator, TetR family n=1 Tax=Deinococcus reticulitermitis TaxID=856736 RepID=A0A1H6T4R1_9DEIO|nr:helix-turn-helix domain-containing protein [Deinococcus reticulitermitis]SEI71260.1 transcriptional regulator, TetR family [Deinococcus reticulitermitis]